MFVNYQGRHCLYNTGFCPCKFLLCACTGVSQASACSLRTSMSASGLAKHDLRASRAQRTAAPTRSFPQASTLRLARQPAPKLLLWALQSRLKVPPPSLGPHHRRKLLHPKLPWPLGLQSKATLQQFPAMPPAASSLQAATPQAGPPPLLPQHRRCAHRPQKQAPAMQAAVLGAFATLAVSCEPFALMMSALRLS